MFLMIPELKAVVDKEKPPFKQGGELFSINPHFITRQTP